MVDVIIGIAGASGSGKTTIAKRISKELRSDAVIINHDAYYRDFKNLTVEERAKLNFDHPDSLDTALMIENIKALKNGVPIEKPEYDFTVHSRKSTTVTVAPVSVIIVEGILIFTDAKLRELFDIKIFVDTDLDLCLIRRIERDVKERGRSLDSVLTQYQQTVKPMYHEFVEASKRYADIIIPEGGFNDVANRAIITQAKAMISRQIKQ
jgi:uridine kinase